MNKHGKIYDNTINWSLDSSKLAYIAEEKNNKKETSFFTSTIKTTNGTPNDNAIDENNYEEVMILNFKFYFKFYNKTFFLNLRNTLIPM